MLRTRAYWLWPALLALSLYAVTIPGTYTYDDVFAAQGDPRLHDVRLWPDYLREGYVPGAADNLWRPLVSLTYAVEWKLHGDRPWIFHLINVLLHAIATALVAALGKRLVNARAGLIAGLLFAAHPVHVEAVAGIVGRAEEMALIGVLAALLVFVDRPMTRGRALGIIGWFLFAAFCKEQGLLIPLMLVAWSFLNHRWPAATGTLPASIASDQVAALEYETRVGSKAAFTPEQKATRMLVALFTLTMAAYITYRNHILPWYWERVFLEPTYNPLVKSVGPDRWLIPVAVLGRYAVLLFTPFHLSLDYGMNVFTPKLNWHEPYFYLGLVALMFVGVLLMVLWLRRRLAPFFMLICFLLAYFMVSNVIMIGTIMGERLMYVPSAFFCILLAMLLGRLSVRALIPVAALLLVLASIRTVTYAYQWNTRPRLYRYAVDAQPRAAMPYLLLAGETDGATSDALMAEARRQAPDSPQVWGKSAWSKIRQGQLDEAQDFAMRSMRLRGGNGDAVGALMKIGELRQAATNPASQPVR